MRKLSKQEMKLIKGRGEITCTGEAIIICDCSGTLKRVETPCVDVGDSCSAYCGPACTWYETIVGCAQ